jgi:hypothetical protein
MGPDEKPTIWIRLRIAVDMTRELGDQGPGQRNGPYPRRSLRLLDHQLSADLCDGALDGDRRLIEVDV